MTGNDKLRTNTTGDMRMLANLRHRFADGSPSTLCMRFVTFIYLKGVNNYRIIKDSCLFRCAGILVRLCTAWFLLFFA